MTISSNAGEPIKKFHSQTYITQRNRSRADFGGTTNG